jgi:hypothetical protein
VHEPPRRLRESRSGRRLKRSLRPVDDACMDSQLEFIRGLRVKLKQAGLNPGDYSFRKLNECVRAYVKRPPGSLDEAARLLGGSRGRFQRPKWRRTPAPGEGREFLSWPVPADRPQGWHRREYELPFDPEPALRKLGAAWDEVKD